MVNGEPLKVDVPTRSELRLDWAGDVDRAPDAEFGEPVLDHLEVDGDDACHLDGAAEGDLAVALGEVEVAHAELGAGHVDGEEYLGALWLFVSSL